jgi:hypothetical protein
MGPLRCRRFQPMHRCRLIRGHAIPVNQHHLQTELRNRIARLCRLFEQVDRTRMIACLKTLPRLIVQIPSGQLPAVGHSGSRWP